MRQSVYFALLFVIIMYFFLIMDFFLNFTNLRAQNNMLIVASICKRTNKYCIWCFVLLGKFSRLLRA